MHLFPGGIDLTGAPGNVALAGDGPVGVCVLELAAGRVLQTCVARGCDLVLLGIRGLPLLGDRVRLGPGRLVAWPRGEPLTVRAGDTGARLCVVAVPAGAEQVLAALSRGDLPVGSTVALAADSGVELVLS